MKRLVALMLGGCLAAGAYATDFKANFEPSDYSGSADGVVLSGQQDWYLPSVGGLDWKVYTYKDNVLGVPDHPTNGAKQFAAGHHAGELARAQHLFDFTAGDQWVIQYDVLARRISDPPYSDNLTSFSLQPSANTTAYILLVTWKDVNDGSTLRGGYIHYDEDGNESADNPPAEFPDGPDGMWNNIQADTWYRLTTKIDFVENRITSVGITNLATGDSVVVDDPVDSRNGQYYYLRGGKDNFAELERPTDFRCFCGGSTSNQAAVYDTLSVTAPVTEVRGDSNCDGQVDFNDIDCFVAALIGEDSWKNCGGGSGCTYVGVNDINQDGSVDFNDIDGFVECIINGSCP